MKKYWITALILLGLIPIVQAREVSVRTVDWPPYYGSSLDKQGPLVEISRAALKVKGHTLAIKFIPWQRALVKVEDGTYDMVLGAYDTPERRKKYFPSDQIYSVKELVIGLASTGVNSFKSLKDLEGYKFGVVRGFAYSKEFQNATFLNRDLSSSEVSNVKKLFAKRVHFIVMNPAGFKENMKKVNDPNAMKEKYVYLAPPLSENSVLNLFSRRVKDGEAIARDFNEGLKAIKEDGTYEKILEQYGLFN